jgi:hypothetical protein
MADKAKIVMALAKLDPQNPEHWTDDGSPRTSVVQTLASDPTIKRSDINSTAPEFTRATVLAAREAETTAANAEPAAFKTVAGSTGTVVEPDFENEAEARAFYNDRISEASGELDDARRAVTAAQALVREKEVALQDTRNDLQRQFPPLTVAENLKQHLERSAQNRAAAANGGKSQIDQAMSRGNSRGWKRPVRSVQTAVGAGTGA